MKLREYLNENDAEDKKMVKKMVDDFIKKFKTMKKVRQAILDNVVNNKHEHFSNSFVEACWDEFNKRFPS